MSNFKLVKFEKEVRKRRSLRNDRGTFKRRENKNLKDVLNQTSPYVCKWIEFLVLHKATLDKLNIFNICNLIIGDKGYLIDLTNFKIISEYGRVAPREVSLIFEVKDMDDVRNVQNNLKIISYGLSGDVVVTDSFVTIKMKYEVMQRVI